VRFLVDAQLPRGLSTALVLAGHDSLHSSDLPDGNKTTDRVLADVADSEHRVVVTKDGDFRNSHLLIGRPGRLLVVKTGNITNARLLELFESNLQAIVDALEGASFVEISDTSLVVHGALAVGGPPLEPAPREPPA
jgi:predicted nuclease of predicted toxin-antitoxin system